MELASETTSTTRVKIVVSGFEGQWLVLQL